MIRLVILVMAASAGCSSSTNEPKGSGGAGGGSGQTSTGGSGGTGTGGMPGTGGSSAFGGSMGTGGIIGTGGSVSTGGSSATGGNSATGGRTGTGGSATGGTLAAGGSAGATTGGASGGGGGTGTGGSSGTGGTSVVDGGPNKDTLGAREGGPEDVVKNDVRPSAEVGNAGNDGAGGAGDAATYQPCPSNGDPCKLLPLGDSITWGIQYDGAYRVELFSKAVAAQQKITFTGSLSNGPTTVAGQAFPQKNEGHSGWTIAQDTGLIPSPAMDTGSGGIPHIVLLHIGTNDIYASSGQATMPDRLGTLIDKIIAAAPNALLVVAKITPLSTASWNATIKTYNDAIPGVVQTRVAAGKHVLLADMNTGFTTGMLSSDGVHPNQSGYNFMGDQWYSVISAVLPK